MALQQQYINNQGITLDYWVITNISKNIIYKTAEITLAGYLSQQAKINGYEAIEIRRIKVLWDKFDQYFSIDSLNSEGTNDIYMGYNYIKGNEEMFKNSLDL